MPRSRAKCAERGYFLSFAANITYPKNVHLREAAAAVPLDRLLTETDSPFLSPQKQRGTDNSPSNVIAVIGAIAQARGETFDVVFEATEHNAFAAFPALRDPPNAPECTGFAPNTCSSSSLQ